MANLFIRRKDQGWLNSADGTIVLFWCLLSQLMCSEKILQLMCSGKQCIVSEMKLSLLYGDASIKQTSNYIEDCQDKLMMHGSDVDRKIEKAAATRSFQIRFYNVIFRVDVSNKMF